MISEWAQSAGCVWIDPAPRWNQFRSGAHIDREWGPFRPTSLPVPAQRWTRRNGIVAVLHAGSGEAPRICTATGFRQWASVPIHPQLDDWILKMSVDIWDPPGQTRVYIAPGISRPEYEILDYQNHFEVTGARKALLVIPPDGHPLRFEIRMGA